MKIKALALAMIVGLGVLVVGCSKPADDSTAPATAGAATAGAATAGAATAGTAGTAGTTS